MAKKNLNKTFMVENIVVTWNSFIIDEIYKRLLTLFTFNSKADGITESLLINAFARFCKIPIGIQEINIKQNAITIKSQNLK